MEPTTGIPSIDLERRRVAKDSPGVSSSLYGVAARRHLPPTPMVSDSIYLHIPLPERPIPPAALARLFSELVETVVVRNDSTLLISEATPDDDCTEPDSPALHLTVEQSTSQDIDVDALLDDLRGIVHRFTNADYPGTETSA